MVSIAIASLAITALASTSDVRSERFIDLPAILLPETVTPTIVNGKGGEIVFAFVLDTTGRIELPTVETLLAPDSTSAAQARATLATVRYIPARMVQDLGDCIRIDGRLAHCGGTKPGVRKVRVRTVLRLESYRVPG